LVDAGAYVWIPVVSFYQPGSFTSVEAAAGVFTYVAITAAGDGTYNNVRQALSGQDLVIKAVYMGLDPAGAIAPDDVTYIVTVDIAWVPVVSNFALMPA